MNVVVYDCEIKKGIPSKDHPPEQDIQYAAGWRDFDNMGISLITCYDFRDCLPRVFMDDNIEEFFKLVEDDAIIVGFNNHNFDDKLVAKIGLKTAPYRRAESTNEIAADILNREFNNDLPVSSFDLLRAIWKAAGLNPESYGYHHQGFGLDDVCRANVGLGKRGNGALAATLYQRQKYGSLVDYGLTDIMLTTFLLVLCAKQPIINPKQPTERLHVEIPFDIPPISRFV